MKQLMSLLALGLVRCAPDDGGAGGGGGSNGADGGKSGGGAPDGGKSAGSEPGGPGKGPEDVSGLKSALEKERAAVKELKAQLSELSGLAGKAEKAAELEVKLKEYEFRDARDAAIAAAVEAATKDGKSVVDVEKVRRVAEKLGGAQAYASAAAGKLEADVAEIVDLLKGDPGVAAKKDPVLKGQPAAGSKDGSTTDLPHSEWARLRKEDPEGYKAMIEARRAKGGFRIMTPA